MKASITIPLGLLLLVISCTVAQERKTESGLARLDGVNIMSRELWGGHKVKPGDENQYQLQEDIAYLSIHHTQSRATHVKYSEEELLRFVQEYHQGGETGKGELIRFRDIAYHYLVGHTGKIYKGRDESRAPASFTHYLSDSELEGARYKNGKVMPVKVVSKESPGNSVGHLTVSFICGRNSKGVVQDAVLPADSMAEAARLVAELLVKHDLKPSDIRAHREFANTECPGDEIYRWLRGDSMDKAGEGVGLKLIKKEFFKLNK